MMTLLFAKPVYRTMAAGLSLGAILAALLFGGCDPGSHPREATPIASAENTAAETAIPSIAAGSLSAGMVGQRVHVTGQVVQQCPASGCWLKLKGADGETFVDLIPSPVRLSENRVGQPARVTGEVVKRGSELAVKAHQIEFVTDPPDAGDRKN